MELQTVDGEMGRKFGSFRTRRPLRVGGALVVPVIAPDRERIDVLTLTAAVEAHGFKVTEVSSGGVVNELLCSNPSERNVLVIQGELLTGGKQDRMVAFDVLLGPGTGAKVPVNCVESGRWEHCSADFRPSDEIAPESFRSRGVTSRGGAVAERAAAENQREVWSGVAMSLECLSAHTPTNSIHAMFRTDADHRVRAEADTYQPLPDQVGHVIVEGGTPVRAEFLADPDLYAQYCRQLLRAALRRTHPDDWGTGSPPANLKESVWRFLRGFLSAQPKRTPGIALGWELRVALKGVPGFALEHNDRLVHAAFTNGR